MGWIFGRWYAEQYYPEESANAATEMAANLREAYQKIVNESGWMEAQVAAAAVQKLEDMDFLIGAPFQVRFHTLSFSVLFFFFFFLPLSVTTKT
jgi:predicted metalloendopeptidase